MMFKVKHLELNYQIQLYLEVTETEPGIKGDTASGGTKPATLETGLICSSSILH